MHGAAEQFDEKTEMSFGYIQVSLVNIDKQHIIMISL